MKMDWDLETLLLLDGEVHEAGEGLWWQIKVKRVKKTPERPHGIRYSLTLHDSENSRIFGIDNAHGLKKKSKNPGAKRRIEYDHIHEEKLVRAYDYQSAPDLLEDFFDVVEQQLSRRRQ